MVEERVFFDSGEAVPLRLEGVIQIPDSETSQRPAVLVCHPHSQHGGSMEVPVIVSTARELARRGMVALRFNFRGVGRSEGTFGEGSAEVADVAGAAKYLVRWDSVDAERLYLVGYSFGAAVGLSYVEENPGVSAIVALCLPSGSMTLGSLDETFWSEYSEPKLFLAGDRDHICPLPELRSLVDRLAEPKQLMVLDGADHFLWEREQEVAERIAGFLVELS
jgi:alpha/beta superfamily hydrolase